MITVLVRPSNSIIIKKSVIDDVNLELEIIPI